MVSDELVHHWAQRFASPHMGDRGQATHDFVLLGDEAVAVALAILDGRPLAGIAVPNLAYRAALISLGRLGPEAASAVPTLIDWLTRDPSLARDAAMALGNIGEAARRAVPALIDALESDREALDRGTEAIVALSRIGGDEAEAALVALADGPTTSPFARRLCLKALREMRGETGGALGV